MSEIENIQWAEEQTVKGTRGLSKALGEVIGVSQQVLLNKVNPNAAGTHLSLIEAYQLMSHTGDLRILEQMAGALGCSVKQACDKPVSMLNAFSNVISENGDVASLFSKANEDGVISDVEERKLLNEIRESYQALQVLESSIKSYASKSRGQA